MGIQVLSSGVELAVSLAAKYRETEWHHSLNEAKIKSAWLLIDQSPISSVYLRVGGT